MLEGNNFASSKSVKLFCFIIWCITLIYSLPVSAYLSRYLERIILSNFFPSSLSSALAILKFLYPEEKYLTSNNNPPKFIVEFFDEQENIDNINCFSDEGNKWEKSNINFIEKKLKLSFREQFSFRRGRINCSLNDDGIWRWFGVQFSIEQN